MPHLRAVTAFLHGSPWNRGPKVIKYFVSSVVSGEVMEDSRRNTKWIRSAYIVYGIVFAGIMGGLIELLAVSDLINYGIVKLLETNQVGPELNGKFLFPRNWFTLFIILICLMLLFPATSLLRYFSVEDSVRAKYRGLSAEIVSLRQDINDIVRYSENITNYIYPEEDLSRFDTKEVDVKYEISDVGDTQVEARITIECTPEPAHFYRYWIEADPESEPVNFFRDLRFEVTDVSTGRKLDWLLVKSEPKYKMFAVFFPEVSPGVRMQLRVSFMWPGFMRRLIELGATNFSWNYISRSPNSRASLKLEWNFSNKLPKINCRATGRQSHTAKIFSETRLSGTAWIYHDPEASMNAGAISAVEFVRDG